MRTFMMFLRLSPLLFFTLCVLPPLLVRAESPSQNPFAGDAQAIVEGRRISRESALATAT